MTLKNLIVPLLLVALVAAVSVSVRQGQFKPKHVAEAKVEKQLSDYELMHQHVETLFELQHRGYQNIRMDDGGIWKFRAERFEWKPLPYGGRFLDFSNASNGVPFRWNWLGDSNQQYVGMEHGRAA